MQNLDALPQTPASGVKKLGWRGVMKTVRREGKLVITNHDEPEAVILSTEAYAAIAQALQQLESRQEATLEALRQRFDQRLAALQAPGSAKRMRGVMRAPAKLNGALKAGSHR